MQEAILCDPCDKSQYPETIARKHMKASHPKNLTVALSPIPQLDGCTSFSSEISSVTDFSETSSNSSCMSYIQSNDAFDQMPRILATNGVREHCSV